MIRLMMSAVLWLDENLSRRKSSDLSNALSPSHAIVMGEEWSGASVLSELSTIMRPSSPAASLR